ncbi:MAG: molecular chaperone TorD family protein [Planctomycetota bacterium]
MADEITLAVQRMNYYKTLALAFSYPDKNVLAMFPDFLSERENLQAEYDRLFRASEVWLYTTEYSISSEFQRTKALADIMGFYRAFGVGPDKDRPDALANELEFMYYLVFKSLDAFKNGRDEAADEKARLCLDAQKKFFNEYLYPGARQIAEKVAGLSGHKFYLQMSRELLDFLEEENKVFGVGGAINPVSMEKITR